MYEVSLDPCDDGDRMGSEGWKDPATGVSRRTGPPFKGVSLKWRPEGSETGVIPLIPVERGAVWS